MSSVDGPKLVSDLWAAVRETLRTPAQAQDRDAFRPKVPDILASPRLPAPPAGGTIRSGYDADRARAAAEVAGLDTLDVPGVPSRIGITVSFR